ncbi:MAG TPA: peptide-N4-asparagine amidase, partial [Candidatus Binatia bacterium]|nr:peptide-N4-asparagine amidase [Candidatus Binatia bacterium]
MLVAFILTLLLTGAGLAQNYVAPANPVIGSANTVTANPPVPRPPTMPCTVTLFQNYDFADFNPKFFTYTPPAGCPGPWAAVVFEADWSVDAGRQFDRTAEVWIGGTNVYFGTTAEPSHDVQRSWHVESNLTEYTPLFTAAQGGRVDLGNLVNDTYTSHYHGSAYLQFYPLAQGQNPPSTASLVLPMAADSTGGTVTLNSPSDQLAKTFTLPANVERAYLEVFAQGQQTDEFWYSCAPDDVAGELENCGSTGFREAEISIDGQPAGVAPIFPWIFTGGIDPYLWRPIPGVHTLNFEPYRVDLTPFAAILSNGQQHTVALSVYNADMYFSATATLLLYQDMGSTQVTGALTSNTIGQPDPVLTENIASLPAIVWGTLS